MSTMPFADLTALATDFRQQLTNKKFILLYAYNGTGKTRLSTEFKDLGKAMNTDGEVTQRDTLYFNAFTEDLFSWHNDLDGDIERYLILHPSSRFFAGLEELEMDTRIRPLLQRYVDFYFRLDKIAVKDEHGKVQREERIVRFSRDVTDGMTTTTVDNIKISRGEENIFIWCFFLATVQLVLDGAEAYKWVKYVYVDDPISSLDEHNAIVVANHFVQLYREATKVDIGTVISTHHNLFFNVLHYELKSSFKGKASQYVLSRVRATDTYELQSQPGDTPSFHHVAALVELDKVARGKEIQTFHFNMLRAIFEKTALFLGYTHFSVCIKRDAADADGLLHQRFIDLLSHGKYSLYEPVQMGSETREYFRKIIREFLERYPYNKALFSNDPIPESDSAS